MKERKSNCKKCGNEIIQYGRGRPKKLCDECKGKEMAAKQGIAYIPDEKKEKLSASERMEHARETKVSNAKATKRRDNLVEKAIEVARKEFPNSKISNKNASYVPENTVFIEIWEENVARMFRYSGYEEYGAD